MPLKMVNESLLFWLQQIRQDINAGAYQIQLVKSDYTPAAADTMASATEADFDGYGFQVLNGFSPPMLVADRAFTSTAPFVWVCTGSVTPNDIYAIRVFDSGNNILVWAERLAGAPIAMDAAGKTISYTPSLTAKSEF